MKKALLFVLFFFCFTQMRAQNNELWQKVNPSSVFAKNQAITDDERLYYTLNDSFLKQKLAKTLVASDDKITAEITFPNVKGILERFSVWQSSNFDPELQAKYPDIRAYEGVGIDDKAARIYFSVSPLGLQTMILRKDSNDEFIENNPESESQYMVFASKNNNLSKSRLACATIDMPNVVSNYGSTSKIGASNKVFKTLRLALSCTAEYTTYFGGTKTGALTGMNATMTRVNAIFARDLAVKLVLIPNNEAVIYTDVSTDPYSAASAGSAGSWNLEVQRTLTSVIGNDNYDIGHLFGASGGGGDAGCIGCVCVNPENSNSKAKGSAFTSPSNAIPKGDTFDIDYVAHEFGHQLGANHSFSYSLEYEGVSVEPGSGSTIMGYAGVTDDYDVQPRSDDYFAYVSILQIQNNLSGKSCPISTPILNTPPVINAGLDYTIPKETAFVLNGGGSDAENDTIMYCWEQNDSAATTSGSNSRAYLTKPDGPMFRSFAPTISPRRYFPSFDLVLQNRLSSNWESVSSISKTMRFTLTGRDNATNDSAQTSTDLMLVTVNASTGPFVLTSQNTDNISWTNASQQLVTWNVNNTTSLVGSSTVNIKLSTDGGLTFSTVLASNTPNDGSEVITVPADVKATNCRILIEPTANIYFAVNSKPFSIGYTTVTNCNSYSFGNAFVIPYSNSFTSRTLTVPASAKIISDVNISVNVTHTNMSDLEFQIVSPQGTVVNLFYKDCVGSSNQNVILQFDDSGTNLNCALSTEQIVIPFESLGAFTGENLQGIWTFRVRDAVAGNNSGTINAVSLNICDQTYTLGIEEIEGIDFVLYPNPNKGSFTVQFSSDSINDVKVFAHDILGKKVYEKTFERASVFSQNIQLPITSLGVYLVTVIDGDKKTVRKIVVN